MAAEPKVETGASFLTTPVTEAHFLTAEKLNEEQRDIQQSAATFVAREVTPKSDAIDAQEPGLMPSLVKLAGEQGLLMIDVPEEYGGADLGLVVSSLVASEMRQASFAVAHGAHTTIGTLPIVFYGTDDQKRRYLPKLATGELIGAYALTEPGVGSDAMSIRTRATLSEDGKHYILNGAKQWISNAGFTDVMVVFAKVDDTKHTGFIVETAWPGVSTGAEEHKVGIKGSSTRTVYFDNVQVPVENVLGEIGKGYKIAFNILNIGRLKLGMGSAGGARACLDMAAAYANERKAFGRPLSGFGLIKKKLANMAADTYAAESLALRTVGMVEDARVAAGEDRQAQLAAIEEFAIECSIAKVYGTEALARCADEGVQIFGGYGFMDEYPISHVYRDNRINRIFEGTNEVNRLADDVDDAAEHARADRNRDRGAGVKDVLTADQAFGRVHGDGAHGVLTEMLRDFENQALAAVLGLKRVQDRWQMILELHVDDGADDLRDLSDSVGCGHIVLVTDYSASAPEMISISSLVIIA